MQNPLVMTIIGKDRTGLVESIARLIADNGGNWLESRMGRLGGEFAGILRIHVPKDREQTLLQALRTLDSEGLTVVVRPDEAAAAAAGQAKSATLNLIGHDRPGIVYQISAALANHDINVEELETKCYSAPMSGEMTFTAMALLQIPETCDIASLRRELEKIGGELMVDISFAEA